MAQLDLEAFIRERVGIFDESQDASPGSPFDVQVIQPIVRRLGADPFTVDFQTFVLTVLNQEFPDLATKEGDAVTDLLIKPATLLWDPLIREIFRIRNNLSFRDPTTLTVEEAEALGANLFSQRNTGNFARGNMRLYYAQPQNASLTPANFATSKGNLHFFPTERQSISVNEMIFNVEGGLYFFDVNLIAEAPGDQYNIGPDEMASIANMPSVVRITNKRRFRFGVPEEDAVSFVDRAEQELTERSLVTLRGINARLTKSFPEVTRLGVVGFNDPEMQRDVVTGGGLGELKAFGFTAQPVSDGEGQARTRRLDMSSEGADFTSLIGPTSVTPKGWVLTLVDAFSPDPPRIRDLDIRRLVSSTQIDLEEQIVNQGSGNTYLWMLRKRELTLSGIPGGIVFPEGVNGTITVPDDEIHIGGTTDIMVRGAALDASSLVIDNVSDDSPIFSGTKAHVLDGVGHVELTDYILGTDYTVGDSTYQTFMDAQAKGLTLQILEGAAAGTYRIVGLSQSAAFGPIFTLDPFPALVGGDLRWRLLDEIDIDLTDPKETRIAGTDLQTVIGTDTVDTASGVDFDAVGVSINDILQIESGPDTGDYTVLQVLTPFFTRIQLDRKLTSSHSGVKYKVFRRNAEGGIKLPLVRVSSVELLDSSAQPVGSTVPYAKAVDIRSRSFANFASGIKVDVRDARLGLVSKVLTGTPPGANVNGKTLLLEWGGESPGSQTITFTAPDPVSVSNIVIAINAAVGNNTAFVIGGNRFGITSPGGEARITDGTARADLFGGDDVYTSRDVRSDTVDELENNGFTGWASLPTGVDPEVDVVNVLDGYQIGFYGNPQLGTDVFGGLQISTALMVDEGLNFAPEANRHVQFGSRSIGTARAYFLDPTTVEFGPDSVFTTTVDGMELHFTPDPTLHAQIVTALPNGAKPMDGASTTGGNTFTSAGTDFIKKGVLGTDPVHNRARYKLIIDYVPLTGTVNLADPVATLALKTIILSIDGGSDKVVTFVHDSTSIPSTSVTRAGVADQINKTVGKNICKITSSGGTFLEFEFDGSVVVRPTGTANALLGFSTTVDQNNDSEHRGEYDITAVAINSLTVDPPFAGTAGSYTREQFKIFKLGVQRIGATAMSTQKAEAGLYYADVELVSEGTGNLWNVAADLRMTAEGYISDGYWLTSDDSNLTFSPAEPVRMHLSRTMLEVGVSDDPENATQLSGQNLRVTYERSSLVEAVENFITAETERVVCSDPLARHLIPHFVRFDMTYLGGSKESVVVPIVEKYINDLFPDDFLEVSDLQKILSDNGATSITNPVDLVAVVHDVDRNIFLDRSKNRLNTGRLAAFIPDLINIVRKVT